MWPQLGPRTECRCRSGRALHVFAARSAHNTSRLLGPRSACRRRSAKLPAPPAHPPRAVLSPFLFRASQAPRPRDAAALPGRRLRAGRAERAPLPGAAGRLAGRPPCRFWSRSAQHYGGARPEQQKAHALSGAARRARLGSWVGGRRRGGAVAAAAASARGVVHGEMFPLVRSDTGNRLNC